MSTTLNTQTRDKVGTRHTHALRASGRIPASLLADGQNPQLSISIDAEEFLTSRRRHEHVYTLAYGGKSESALVRELQWDTFGERILHVEFRRVDLSQKTEVDVPLEYVGHPKAGLVNHLLVELPVKAKPEEIPDSIEVRVEGLEIGALILAGELKLPAGVELAIDPETQVASIVQPHAEKASEEEIAESEEAAAAAAAIPVPAAKPEGK